MFSFSFLRWLFDTHFLFSSARPDWTGPTPMVFPLGLCSTGVPGDYAYTKRDITGIYTNILYPLAGPLHLTPFRHEAIRHLGRDVPLGPAYAGVKEKGSAAERCTGDTHAMALKIGGTRYVPPNRVSRRPPEVGLEVETNARRRAASGAHCSM